MVVLLSMTRDRIDGVGCKTSVGRGARCVELADTCRRTCGTVGTSEIWRPPDAGPACLAFKW